LEQGNILGNGLKLLGEVFVPGAAELLEGRLGSGLAHNVIAGAATMALVGVSPFLAGLTVFAVKADSFSRSVNDQNLWDAVTGVVGRRNGGTTSRSTPSGVSGPATKP
jgi:hypothetical protein